MFTYSKISVMKTSIIYIFILVGLNAFAQNNVNFKMDPIGINSTVLKNSVFSVNTLCQFNSGLHPLDTIIKTNPKILLYKGLSRGGDGKAHFSIVGFKLEGKTPVEFHHVMRELKQYIKNDHKAFRLYRRARFYDVTSTVACAFIFIPLLALAASNPGIDASLGLPLGISAFSICTFAVTKIISNKSLRKSVKVYNQNAGYGYINGLEEK